MDWLFWTALIFLGLYLIGKASAASQKRKQAAETEKINAEAQEIADKITTTAKFRALEQRLEAASDRMSTLKSDRAIENAQHKADVLQAAVDLLSLKTFKYQFIPDINLDSPKETLDRAYKVYSINQYEEFEKEKFFNESDWEGLGPEDEEEEFEVDLKGLKKFRKIIDSNASREQKIRKLDQLIEDHIDIFDEFIDFNSELTPGDQYFSWQMEKDGLPLAAELYKQGYTTPEKCLDIELEEFRKIEGGDPKKLEQLIKYQVKVRGDVLAQPESKETHINGRAVFKIDMS